MFLFCKFSPSGQESDKPMPENTFLNSEEKRVLLFCNYSTCSEKVIDYHMDSHSLILNESEWTSLLGSKVYFEELDLHIRKLHKGREPYKRDSL